ncbi:MAG: CRISPR-associated protein Csm1 [Eubacteriales bacterium]|nr:CRISPR-associated protein Csm1 [Eubacteriales bacterium]
MKELYLAALLHDIGKFYQRADKEMRYEKHARAGSVFLNRFLAGRLANGERDRVVEMVARHHEPQTYWDYVLAIADKLSAMEREEQEGEKGEAAAEPLVAILSRVKLGDKGGEEAYHPLRLPDPNKPSYPEKAKEKALREGDYRDFWQQFTGEMEKVSDLGDTAGRLTLYYLLQKYLTAVPSAAYYSRTTISLFDHARTTAAIALALAQEKPEHKELEEIHAALVKYLLAPEKERAQREEEIPARERFFLLGGDISGIQDFIYDIPMDDAARNLRGRSFLVAYLCHFLARWLAAEEGLAEANILLAGGGKFTLLLPAGAAGRLDSYREKLEREFYQAFGGRLKVFLAGISLTYRDFLPGKIAAKWDELGGEIERAKRRPWGSLLAAGVDLWQPREDEGTCPVCEQRPREEEGWCSFCSSLRDLGQMVGQARVLAERRREPRGGTVRTLGDFFARFGWEMVLSEKTQPGYKNFLLGGFDFIGQKCQGFFFAPVWEPKAFDSLAEKSSGLATWGVLRGDVDHLGRIFREGLPDLTISGLAALSRSLSEFFGLYFAGLLTNWRDEVYLIYAGGDDFCLVGSWSELPRVAQHLRREFSRYCAKNPALTFSAAIRLAPGVKFPFYRVAAAAGDLLEEKAKGEGRNRIAFLDRSFTWEEFKDAEEIKNLIVHIITNGGSRALISILRFTGPVDDYRTAWRLAYHLARYRDTLAGEKLRATMEELMDRLLPEDRYVYPFTLEVARWAELETRRGGDEE